MTQRIEIAGIRLRILDPDFGAGGQGKAMLVEPEDLPGTRMVLKELPYKPETEARLKWVCQRNLAQLTAAFAAPIICETTGQGTILHLAPLAEGVPQEDDPARALPHNLQICLEFVCLLLLLEENGLSHGDISPNNVFIAPDGRVSLIDFDGCLAYDPDVPPPDTIGTRPMLAPEQRDGTRQAPTRESGYYQAGMMLSMIIRQHYPTDGMPSEPNAVDQILCHGGWPEHLRPLDPGEDPIDILGGELIALFDRAFSLNPTDRPNYDEWRRALIRALHNCWIHDCGAAFVADATTTTACPDCGASIQIPSGKKQLKIQLLPTGGRFGVEIKDQTPIILGRSTMTGLPPTVSGRHLEILPFKGKLFLRHVGSNPTLIQQGGQWYQLQETWLDEPGPNAPIELQLADQRLNIVSGS